MLIDVAKMAKNTHILFSQFFARFANGYMANHNGNPLGLTSVISLLMFATPALARISSVYGVSRRYDGSRPQSVLVLACVRLWRVTSDLSSCSS